VQDKLNYFTEHHMTFI